MICIDWHGNANGRIEKKHVYLEVEDICEDCEAHVELKKISKEIGNW